MQASMKRNMRAKNRGTGDVRGICARKAISQRREQTANVGKMDMLSDYLKENMRANGMKEEIKGVSFHECNL